MKVFDLLNTCGNGFAAYRFYGRHDDDMSGYWVKRNRIPELLVETKLFTWRVERDRLCLQVDDETLEKVLYTIDGGDGRHNQPITAC